MQDGHIGADVWKLGECSPPDEVIRAAEEARSKVNSPPSCNEIVDLECYRVVLARIRKFGLDPNSGFLPPAGCLKKLTAEKFAPWENLMDELSGRLHAKRIREAIDALPLISIEGLQDDAESERAMLVLSMLGAAYVWGEKHVSSFVPRVIAQPWCAVAKLLDRPPILACHSICHANFRVFDTTSVKPIGLGNIACNNLFFGGLDEAWFYLVTVDVESKGAGALLAMCAAQYCVEARDPEQLLVHLKAIFATIQEMQVSLDRLHENCTPEAFYGRVRPFLAGWKGSAQLPNGLIYQGEFDGEPQKFYGASAAQTPIIPCFDAILGVQHKSSRSADYMTAIRGYMHQDHRKFIASLEAGPSVGDYVHQIETTFPKLKQLHAQCVTALREFRSTHIGIVARYIISQASRHDPFDPTDPDTVGAPEFMHRGTGGTDIMPFLKAVRDETCAILT